MALLLTVCLSCCTFKSCPNLVQVVFDPQVFFLTTEHLVWLSPLEWLLIAFNYLFEGSLTSIGGRFAWRYVESPNPLIFASSAGKVPQNAEEGHNPSPLFAKRVQRDRSVSPRIHLTLEILHVNISAVCCNCVDFGLRQTECLGTCNGSPNLTTISAIRVARLLCLGICNIGSITDRHSQSHHRVSP
jgi:hypothetical protein